MLPAKQVPFPVESILSGVGRHEPRMWYRRELTLPTSWAPGSRVLLHFDAVDQEASVWLNGVPLGSHYGGYGRFTFASPPSPLGLPYHASLKLYGSKPGTCCEFCCTVKFGSKLIPFFPNGTLWHLCEGCSRARAALPVSLRRL